MLGFIATGRGAEAPTGPSIDPPTYAHPSQALSRAGRLAAFGPPQTAEEAVAAVTYVWADPAKWSPACPDCLRAVGLAHDCTGGDGVVREFDAVLMLKGRVRT